jgi:hypothetical protein
MLRALAQFGTPPVGLDPSMTLTYRSKYKEAGIDVPEILLLQESLAAHIRRQEGDRRPSRFAVIPHCTERTTALQAVGLWKVAFERLGSDLDILEAGCCGMAAPTVTRSNSGTRPDGSLI